MEEGKWGQERHFELFRERSRTTSRLALGTLFFAFVVLYKVVEPYTGLAHSIADKEIQLAELELELESSAIETRQLVATEEILVRTQAELARAPWMDRTDHLVLELSALDDAHALLSNADLDLVRLHVDKDAPERLQHEPMDGEASLGRLDSEPEFDAGRITAQSEGNARPFTAQAQSTLQIPGEIQPLERSRLGPQAFGLETLYPLENRFDELVERFELSETEAARAREFLLRAPNAGPESPTIIASDALGLRNATNLNRELIRLNQQVHTLHQMPAALDLLHLEPERMEFQWAGDDADMEFQKLLNQQLLQHAQEAADRTIQAISDDLKRRVLNPLEQVLQAPGAESRTPQVSERVERLSYELAQWTESKLGDRAWYRSRSQKESTGADLGRALDSLVERTSEALAEDSKLVRAEQERLNERFATVGEQVQEGEELRASLALRLENVLPAWLKGLFDTPELIQLYPLGMILMILAWFRNAWFLRIHAQALLGYRGKHGGVIDTSLRSSLWVPVRRGSLSTVSTFVAYSAASALLWVLFERGCAHLEEWQSVALQSEQIMNGSWPRALPWLGRAVLLGAGGCALIATLGGSQSTPSTPAPQT